MCTLKVETTMADKSSESSAKYTGTEMYTAPSARSLNAYTREAAATRVASASPHALIAMLYEGIDQSLLTAIGALERGDLAGKGTALGKAIRLISEGLRPALSPEGGELTQRLDTLYGYCIARLTEANLRNDKGMIEEVRGLLEPVADAWNQIRPEGTGR